MKRSKSTIPLQGGEKRKARKKEGNLTDYFSLDR
jgi:hypothetical protein